MEKVVINSLGNRISFLRLIPLYLSIIIFILDFNLWIKVLGILLLVITFFMDYVDGYCSKKTKTNSKFGGVVDVMIDRVVESSYWITFLFLGFIPIWIVLLMLLRYFVTDGFRSVALMYRMGTFEMMKSPLGKFIVGSRFSRGFFSVFKVITFSFLGILTINTPFILNNFETMKIIGLTLTIILLLYNLVRGFYTVKDTLGSISN